MVKIVLVALAAIASAGLVYWFVIRPWHLRWGATDAEVQRSLPGDDLIPEPVSEATRAITIHAPAAEVWPWLVQMGQGRGGLYSYDWLENLIGCDIHSADRIIPKLGNLEVGDTVRLASEDRYPDARLTVAAIEPDHALVLRSPLDSGPEDSNETDLSFSWAYVLIAADEQTTRLIIRSRYGFKPGRAGVLFLSLFEPIPFVMERKMLLGIRQRAEAAAGG
jgi:hypothetical protein